MKKLIYCLCFLYSPVLLFSQDACPCCTPEHQLFDFWVGDWVVYDTTGRQIGENYIVKLEDNCILNEHWTGGGGSTGRSYNYYNRADSTWNQLWIDNGGNPLILKGKGSSGKMVLRSELVPGRRIDWLYNQITWTLNADGSVTQHWEVFDKNNQKLATAFKGIYRHRVLSQGDTTLRNTIAQQTAAMDLSNTASRRFTRPDSMEVAVFSDGGADTRIRTQKSEAAGMLTTDWYYHKGQPIFAHQTFVYHHNAAMTAMWHNPDGRWAWESRYYFEHHQLVYQSHTGRPGILGTLDAAGLLEEAEALKGY